MPLCWHLYSLHVMINFHQINLLSLSDVVQCTCKLRLIAVNGHYPQFIWMAKFRQDERSLKFLSLHYWMEIFVPIFCLELVQFLTHQCLTQQDADETWVYVLDRDLTWMGYLMIGHKMLWTREKRVHESSLNLFLYPTTKRITFLKWCSCHIS